MAPGTQQQRPVAVKNQSPWIRCPGWALAGNRGNEIQGLPPRLSATCAAVVAGELGRSGWREGPAEPGVRSPSAGAHFGGGRDATGGGATQPASSPALTSRRHGGFLTAAAETVVRAPGPEFFCQRPGRGERVYNHAAGLFQAAEHGTIQGIEQRQGPWRRRLRPPLDIG